MTDQTENTEFETAFDETAAPEDQAAAENNLAERRKREADSVNEFAEEFGRDEDDAQKDKK